MRISRRPSGGRGEYELHGTLLDGTRARNLEGYFITLEFPNGLVIHTRVRMLIQGGKPRLRRLDRAKRYLQVQKQLAAMFIMPDPAREMDALGAGEPVMQEGAYAIEHIDVDDVIRVSNDTIVLRVSRVTYVNQSHLGEEMDLRERGMLLESVWKRRKEFPDDIAALLEEHERMVRSEYVDAETQAVVARLQRIVSERSDDLGIVYSYRGDVLPKLGEALQYQVPKPLVEIADVDPEDILLKKRTMKEWKRWANARGPASARFKQDVRRAYRASCIICGGHYPPTPYNSTPGVDAAHILPWRDTDLDEVFNGLCLCKIHHWAFDEALIRIRYDNGRYISEMPEVVQTEIPAYDPAFSLDKLQEGLGVIPLGRFPSDSQQWPHPDLLEMLAEAF